MKTRRPEIFRSGRHFAAWIGLTAKVSRRPAGKVKSRRHYAELGTRSSHAWWSWRAPPPPPPPSVIRKEHLRNGKGRSISHAWVDQLSSASAELAAVWRWPTIGSLAWKLMVTGET